MNTKLTCAIAAILGSATIASPGFAADTSVDATQLRLARGGHRHRAAAHGEHPGVPISMQAFTDQALQQLNIATLDDYIKYLPNVTTANNGPGQNEVFMRGLSAGVAGQPGQRLHRRLAQRRDLSRQPVGAIAEPQPRHLRRRPERIEVLAGPQGTLFGSGAEAGVIRYITNEPKLDVVEGSVKVGYGVTAGGDPKPT